MACIAHLSLSFPTNQIHPTIHPSGMQDWPRASCGGEPSHAPPRPPPHVAPPQRASGTWPHVDLTRADPPTRQRATRPGAEATCTAQLAGAGRGSHAGRPWFLVHLRLLPHLRRRFTFSERDDANMHPSLVGTQNALRLLLESNFFQLKHCSQPILHFYLALHKPLESV